MSIASLVWTSSSTACPSILIAVTDTNTGNTPDGIFYEESNELKVLTSNTLKIGTYLLTIKGTI
jgi:hypothetical protein